MPSEIFIAAAQSKKTILKLINHLKIFNFSGPSLHSSEHDAGLDIRLQKNNNNKSLNI
jgi:hypothetical protein